MGSGSSKDTVGVVESSSSSSSSSRGRSGSRSFGRRFFGSACLGLPQVLSDEKNEEETGRVKESVCKEEQDSEHLKFAQTGALPLSNSNFRTDEGNQENAPRTNADVSSSSATQDTPITSAPTRSHSRSRFGFFPDGIGFRLGRAASLGSSNANIVFSRSFSIPQAGEDHQTERRNDGSSDNRSRSYQDSLIDAISAQDAGTHNSRPNSETRRAHRRLQESTEGTARFSRTLSVGRLRDRVLRRTSLPEGRFGSTLSEEGSLGYIRQGSGRRYLSGLSNIYSTMSDEMPPTSGSNNSRNLDSSYDNETVTPQLRESSTQDSLEHRSAFLERRRRIRSQVRALQRLGSRFENLSGHDRSCILSGQHHTGRCACRTNTRSANSGDDTSTRASISRIVMLAEALFEVLDEIHQQAVVLASRPSISSIGSVPAPKEVVDSMPVKIYTKTQKQQNDDAAQCLICLVEYEDGDCMRVLPCHHEFHRTCVDKWLKEIHRVCPLCRGDICISDASPVDELD